MVTPDSRLRFYPLSIVAEGDEFLVGHPAAPAYVTIPAVGVAVIEELGKGLTVRQVEELIARRFQEAADVLDFVTALVECGFVEAIDGQPLGALGPQTAPAGAMAWLERIRPETARWLFSRWAWALYGGLGIFCVSVFLLFPQYWPTYKDFFFVPDPAVCALVMTALNLALLAVHELWHWLAARAEGLSARFQVSRRLFLLAFETDVSQLWGLPRNRRYGTFLAGMAFETALLAVCLGVRLASGFGLIDLPLMERFAAALALTRVTSLALQAMIFLRTDLYAVLITALGCTNLYRITYLSLVRMVRPLRPAEQEEVASAGPRDRQAARWFVWLYAAGLCLAAYFFAGYFIPGAMVMGGWVIGAMAGAELGSATFWEALVLGALFLFQTLTPLILFLRERLTTLVRSAQGSPS